MRGEPILRGSDDPSPRSARQRLGRILETFPPLHLDESKPLALQRHEIDLADRRLVTPRHDAIAFQPQQQRDQTLGEQPAAIGSDPPIASFVVALEAEPKLVDPGALQPARLGHVAHGVAEAAALQGEFQLGEDFRVADLRLFG